MHPYVLHLSPMVGITHLWFWKKKEYTIAPTFHSCVERALNLPKFTVRSGSCFDCFLICRSATTGDAWLFCHCSIDLMCVYTTSSKEYGIYFKNKGVNSTVAGISKIKVTNIVN